MKDARSSAGDPIPANCVVIAVRIAELKQLFNSIDPSPFGERDLDPKAEEFIVSWARETHRNATLALVVNLDRPAGLSDESELLGKAIRRFFAQRAQATRLRLRQLFRRGRVSLLIGLIFLAASLASGEMVESAWAARRIGAILGESLLIGGWVAMWRPLEIFLYDWWPIRAEARLYDRLSVMPIRIAYADRGGNEAWRTDWPAASTER